ncbi:N-acetylneuraminate synthase family protein [Jatrophihabitans fulvus]
MAVPDVPPPRFADPDSGCYVIAEIGVNHNGSVSLARELIDAAVAAGADAVKFQTFAAEDLVSVAAPKAEYQSRNMGDADGGGSQYDMLKALELTAEQFGELLAYCDQRGIDFLSTPFGPSQADMLADLGVHAYKVSSGDLTHLPFLAHLAGKGLPIILSTGMGTLAEVAQAVATIEAAGPVPVAVLHCVSNYPADPASCNLAAMATMHQAFGLPVGWSDHTLGPAISLAAVALGARVIEKHITLDVTMDGPDHAASMEPAAFTDFVSGIRAVESAIGDGIKRPVAAELSTASVARRSIVAVRDLQAGDVIGTDDVAVLRPGTGLAPAMIDVVIGARLGRSVAAHQPLTVEDLHG